jgi:hypothetical protein
MATKKCPECGTSHGKRAKFCTNCRAPLDDAPGEAPLPGLIDDSVIDDLAGEGGAAPPETPPLPVKPDAPGPDSPSSGDGERDGADADADADAPAEPEAVEGFSKGVMLDVMAGDRAVYTLPVTEARTVLVGETPAADLRICSDPHLSRKHCDVIFDGSNAWVEDLGSLNGTSVEKPGGVQVTATGRTKLGPGDVLVLGATRVRVRVAAEG